MSFIAAAVVGAHLSSMPAAAAAGGGVAGLRSLFRTRMGLYPGHRAPSGAGYMINDARVGIPSDFSYNPWTSAWQGEQGTWQGMGKSVAPKSQDTSSNWMDTLFGSGGSFQARARNNPNMYRGGSSPNSFTVDQVVDQLLGNDKFTTAMTQAGWTRPNADQSPATKTSGFPWQSALGVGGKVFRKTNDVLVDGGKISDSDMITAAMPAMAMFGLK